MKVIVRAPGPEFCEALSEHVERDRISVAAAAAQHAAFVAALRAAALDVIELRVAAGLADACFPSDVLLALPRADDRDGETAAIVLARPGAPSRRPEVESVAAVVRGLAPQANVSAVAAPGTLDCGDVIVYGRRVAIGVSARTNGVGARQFADAVAAIGYRPFLCPVTDRLHLASAVTVVRPDLLIGTAAGFASLDDAGSDVAPADEVRRLMLPDDEIVGANVLALGGRCFIAAGNPEAVALLEAEGETVVELELSEFTRADGGPTCLVNIVP